MISWWNNVLMCAKKKISFPNFLKKSLIFLLFFLRLLLFFSWRNILFPPLFFSNIPGTQYTKSSYFRPSFFTMFGEQNRFVMSQRSRAETNLLYRRQPFWLPVNSIQSLYMHLNNSWHHLVQRAQMLGGDAALGAHPVHEPRHGPDYRGARLSGVLLFEARFSIRRITFSNAEKKNVNVMKFTEFFRRKILCITKR